MRKIIILASLLLIAQKDPVARSWNQPVEPFRIAGNLFYVGASDIASYLIVTSEGLIVIDGGFEETAPMILASIEKLGYRRGDVRMLLNTHAHYDHAGGLAALRKATGAPVMASQADAPLLAHGGRNDPQFGDRFLYPPVKPDLLFSDGDIVGFGGTKLVAHITPGHTKGCTTWTLRVRDGRQIYDVVIVGSASVPPEYRIVGNPKYRDAVADYEKTFRTLRSLRCDIFLASHGNFFDLSGKIEKMKNGVPHAFVDPAGYRKYIDDSEKRFESIKAVALRNK